MIKEAEPSAWPSLADAFDWWGRFMYRHRCVVILVSVVAAFACGAGFTRIRMEVVNSNLI